LAPALPKPQLWIVAGPNGSGKSSAYSLLGVESPKDTVWIINPDILAKRIADEEKLSLDGANLQAVIRIETWLYASVDAYQTIGVETVLSSGKYRKLVETAKAKGFEINFIYVYLDKVELNIERVRARFQKGGHDVPENKLRERRLRSFDQLSWFLNASDNAYIFNNSGAEPDLVFSQDEEGFSGDVDIIPEIARAISGVYPEFDIFEEE
jgi:predicted ABC-type ATPase